MNFYAITSEFNPFHTGHKYLIEQTKKKTLTDAVVCIMSGSMVQRGDVAVFDKWTRAKAAVQNGIDLVVELPVCYVLQSADIFARGAVEIANALGCQGISFGSECTDTSLIYKMAELKQNEPPEYRNALKKYLDSGLGYPAACEKAARDFLGEIPQEITMPNTTLGISYISAVKKINPNIKIHIEKRLGSYHSDTIGEDFASASALRKILLSGDKIQDYLLCTNDEIYDINNISSLILGFFRMAKEEHLKNISGMEEGLALRLIQKSRETGNLTDFFDACVTKRYTLHRIRRVVLCSILGITSIPSASYIRVLALNSTGAKILKQAKDTCPLEVITKIPNCNQKTNPMLLKDILSTDIAALCVGKSASLDYTTTPIIL